MQFRGKYLNNPFTKITKGIQFGFVEILETKTLFFKKLCLSLYSTHFYQKNP